MIFDRRTFVAGGVAVAAIGAPSLAATSAQTSKTQTNGAAAMHELIGKMKTQPGQRDALAAILLESASGMPGCLSYVIANDPADPDLLWITEVWDSPESHRASLSLPSVQAAIAKGRPLIAGMEMIATTQPLGGHGLTEPMKLTG